MIYGYARISTTKQNIDRQIRNIIAEFPKAEIIEEAYTGTKLDGRQKFEALLKKVNEGDTIVFDSVSRMSRNAEEGIELYFDLFNKGINLVFLKEHYIDTDIYKNNLKDKVELTGADEDELFKGINNYFRLLAKKQIRIAFDQAEKEVMDLRQRTSEGLKTAKLNGKQVGQVAGAKLTTKKSIEMKAKIRKMAKAFDGNMSDKEVMETLRLARNTYYKYKKALAEE